MVWVESIYDMVNEYIDKQEYALDKSCKNISNLFRVPLSVNYKRKNKYWLEPREVEIILEQPQQSALFGNIEAYAEKVLDAIKSNTNKLTQYEWTDDWKYEAIEKINVGELFAYHTWFEMARNKKNFYSKRKKWYIGVYYLEKQNIIMCWWSEHIDQSKKWYWPFDYVREEILWLWNSVSDNDATFKRFEDHYNHIKKIADEQKEARKEKKQQEEKQIEETKKELIDYKDFLVPYDRYFETDVTTPVPFTYGIQRLDDNFGRLERWRFMTTVGESWSWKTTRSFFQWIEISKNYKVLFVSLEMTAQRVIELRARKMAWITIKEWNDKSMEDWKYKLMLKYQEEIKQNQNLEIVWVNKKAESVNVNMVIASLKAKYSDFDFVIIDNLWFIQWDEWDAYKELNSIVREFKNFCQETNITVNMLHHFKKWTSKSRKDRSFADILGTGKLEHDVDYGIFISRFMSDDPYDEPTPEERAEVYVKLAKDRENWVIKKEVIYFMKWKYYQNFDQSIYDQNF